MAPPWLHGTAAAVSAAAARARAVRVAAIVLLLGAASLAAAAPDPDQTRAELAAMARAGAPGLALELMDDAQPEAGEAPQRWIAWERLRLRLLRQAEAWARALERIDAHPTNLPAEFRHWARHQAAQIQLKRGDPAAARAALRRLIWAPEGTASRERLRAWRRTLVRSYLAGGAVDDAVTAMRRFDQDYGESDPAWTTLRARVLLRAGRPDEARARLPDDAQGELKALKLLARLRGDGDDPAAIWRTARAAAEADRASAADRARFWFVAAEAAPGTPAGRALATEEAVARAGALPASDSLFRLGGDAVWDAWLAYGRWYGNEEQLLIGDDSAWFDAVGAALPRYPVRARALLAVIAQQGGADAQRRAHDRLVQRIADSDLGMELVRRAYLHAERYPAARDVPAVVRYALVDDALARDDVSLATRLFADLDTAPEGVDAFGWGLLRARVMVLGGRAEAGVSTLRSLLDRFPRLSGKRLDRLLQVVFDLQGGGYHEQALALLQRLTRRESANQRKRELLYWQAESLEAQERYRRAAELYMRSAVLLDGQGGDQWGQTARYQAAGMLAEAGLVGDARRIYRALLRVTEGEERRTELRRRLQKLGLREAAPANLPAAP